MGILLDGGIKSGGGECGGESIAEADGTSNRFIDVLFRLVKDINCLIRHAVLDLDRRDLAGCGLDKSSNSQLSTSSTD